ncbi:MAG: amidohydrolase [Frankiales bacterium]|nr:amidohydrolase [Frankiales bacterium]MCW2586364.1 amidohydrolase [Frankiales bacterium]
MTTFDDILIIDADTHVVEPPDLWTSRMSVAKWGDRVPHVRWDDKAEEEAWFSGDKRLGAAGAAAMAGWHEYPPFHPRRFSDADPATWDPKQRLAVMDEYGIHAQLLYPNIAVFDAKTIVAMKDAELQLALIQAYNDYLTEWSNFAPGRFVAITGLPFWDIDATVAEIDRCYQAGHKGVTFTQNPAYFGLPEMTDRYWDPMWRAAEERGLPINYHIASGDLDPFSTGHPDNGKHANYAAMGVSFFLANAATISQIITGGICHRFPDLDFVSVESGIGWIPFALEALDWQWKNCGVPQEHPEYELLPSEYFARQIYGCFWFEDKSAKAAIEQLGADNFLYETDFPHPTSMSPGPATTAVRPDEYLDRTFSEVDREAMGKILHGNAARIYHLDF